MPAPLPHGSEKGGEVFAALADPTRRHLVETLASRGGASATALAAELPISRQAVAKHLAALNGVGLVRSHRAGRETVYELQPAPLEEAASWIAEVGAEWDQRLARLQRVLRR
jgi:DNA-binding transcriptional ArsR family regulator